MTDSRHYVGYGTKARGEKRYILRQSDPHHGEVVFQSDYKSDVIAEAQARDGLRPVDGSELTYGGQRARERS